MGERYVIKDRWIFDTKSNKNIHSIDCYEEKNVLDIMNGQNERIAELEEQLKKKPKYNIGDRVYIINKDYEVERDFIESIDIDTFGIEYYTVMHSICWYENELFSTKEEAEAKLKELGEKR